MERKFEVKSRLLVVLLMIVLATALVRANPTAPQSITQGATSTFNPANYGPQTDVASAGNISALVLTGIAQTKTWQGYYGNVSGAITLDDANNFTFYNWTNAHPRGQVYATLNSSITWGSVGCFNYTRQDGYANETTIESYYGVVYNDVDGVDETYNQTNHPAFQVGSRTMSGCPTTYINQNDAAQQANFVDVLLYDNSTAVNQTGWIYTTLIENKTAGAKNGLTCYNGQTCDFQLLVNENGHGTDTATTTYYFWVELL